MPAAVWVSTTFVGVHRWKNAPDQVGFLRDWHRHVFHVKLAVSVVGLDREVEFLQLKEKVNIHLARTYRERFELSCEMIALDLVREFRAKWVEVSEDGENGAIVEGLPSLQTKQKCFVGIEAEGPHRGMRVLFVPGTCSGEQVLEALQKVDVERVYCGAGNLPLTRLDALRVVLLTFPPEKVTVEVEKVGYVDLPEGLTVVSNRAGDLGVCSFVKLTDQDSVKWVAADGREFVTRLDDPLYSLDLDVE